MKIKKYIAEFLGTFFLVATVIGSGIMGDNLSSGNVAVALLGNTIATGAILYVIIKSFEDLSGAHFNPFVSIAMTITGKLKKKLLPFYIIAQLIGCLIGWLVVSLFG